MPITIDSRDNGLGQLGRSKGGYISLAPSMKASGGAMPLLLAMLLPIWELPQISTSQIIDIRNEKKRQT
jgi:hypothetical protein